MTPAKRISASMTLQLETWAKRRPWLVVVAVTGRVVLGGALIAFAGLMTYRVPDSWKAWSLIGAVGSLILPGIPSVIASNARKYIGVWRAAKKDEGKP